MTRLAQRRSLASAALLFLLLVDEIEGLIFLAVGVLLQRGDVFLRIQDLIFPGIVLLSAVVALIRNWHHDRVIQATLVEPVEVAVLAERIGSHASVPASVAVAPTVPVPAMSVRAQWSSTESMTGQRPAGVDAAAPQYLTARVPALQVSSLDAAPQQATQQRPAQSEYRASIAALRAR